MHPFSPIGYYLCSVKKSLVFILAMLYITLTSGVVVNLHYCMGELASVEYGVSDNHQEACGECGMEGETDCCHTEHQLVKADNAHSLAKSFSSYLTAPTALPVQLFTVALAAGFQWELPVDYQVPPDLKDNDLRFYTGVFRI